MKVGIVLEDQNFENLDLRNPELGNNGIGGTQYSFIMLARFLSLLYSDVEICIFHFSKNRLPENVRDYLINDIDEIPDIYKQENIDILILKTGTITQFKNSFDKNEINIIAWAHNYLIESDANFLFTNKNIKRVVFVSKQQYDRYIDHEIINKSTYIYNMFNGYENNDTRPQVYPKVVTYTGSLVPSKGFHILAKEWKKIIKLIPDAQLFVIGSGKLYDRNQKLGIYNLAQKDYEKKIIKHLTDDNGDILSSVHFCGVLGQEKLHIYYKTAVGVINPSARTETFGISAVEMEACGIPIVTKAKNGLLDTVKHKKTGLLSYTRIGFRKNIILLLQDQDLNTRLGKQGKLFVNEEFNPHKISSQWYETIQNSLKGLDPDYIIPNDYYFNNMKILKIVNRKIKKIGFLSKLPSLLRFESIFKAGLDYLKS